MDVILYTDSNLNSPYEAYTRAVSSTLVSFGDNDLHFITYTLDSDVETEELIEYFNDLNENAVKEVTYDIILRPEFIKNYRPNSDLGRNASVKDDGLFSLLQVMKHEDVLFLRLGDKVESDIQDITTKAPEYFKYDASGYVVNTRAIWNLLNTCKITNSFITSEQIRLLIDTFIDSNKFTKYSIVKDDYFTFNEIHKESLLKLYGYLINNVYDKLKHNDQFDNLQKVLNAK